MSFNSYKPFKKRNLLPKYVIVFIFGISFALFFSSAFTIVTGINNAVQYIKQIVLTSDGTVNGTTGIILDGINGKIILDGDIIFVTGSQLGIQQNQISLGINGNVGIGVAPDISYRLNIDGSTQVQGSFLAHEARLGTNISNGHNLTVQGGANINNQFYVTGSRIGIGKNNPQATLDVNGNIEIAGTGNISMLIASKGVFNGSIRVPGLSSATGSSNGCISDGAGAIKYEGGLKELCVCDGTNWKKVYSGSIPCIPGVGGGAGIEVLPDGG